MHEIAIADRILREAKNAGAKSFLRVEVGELTEITADELDEGLRKLTMPFVSDRLGETGSVLTQTAKPNDFDFSSWDFKVEEIESKIECRCGFVGRAKILDRGHGYCLFCCPECEKSGKNLKVLEGGEIKIVEVE